MALRKAGSYSKKYTRPYTRRSTVKGKNYIKAVPPQKVVRFEMGDIKGWLAGKYKLLLRVVSNENVVIRDTAIEAARQYINRQMDTLLPGQHYYAVRVFPHHILRENKMLTGAGADRMQTGMQLSFGKTIGRAAIVKKGREIMLIGVSSMKDIQTAREIIRKIKAKLPCSVSIMFEQVK